MPLIQPFDNEVTFDDQRVDEENIFSYRTAIDEKDAGLCWDLVGQDSQEDCVKWQNFRVINYKAHIAGNLSYYEFEAWCKSEYKSGAASQAWLKTDGFNCYGVFLQAIDEGRMPSGDEFRKILLQFAQIKQCEWARSMLKTLRSIRF